MNARVRRMVPVLAVIGAVAAAALLWRGRSGGPGDAPLEASGTVEATQADLAFQLPGRIARVGPREGENVAAGEELAALDQTEVLSRVDAARAAVAAAEARLAELERGARPAEIAGTGAALEAARQREEEASAEALRAGRLFEGGAISRQALERAETAAAVARSARVQAEQALTLQREGPRAETVAAQRALVEQARAAVRQAEAAVEQGVIRAPFAGRVTVRHRGPGEVIPAGAPVLTLLDPDDRWVRVYVPEGRLGAVSLGQAAELRPAGDPARVHRGSVVFVGDVAEFTPRNVQTAEERTRLVYPVKVRVEGDAAFELKPGLPVDVRLLGGPSGDAAGRPPQP